MTASLNGAATASLLLVSMGISTTASNTSNATADFINCLYDRIGNPTFAFTIASFSSNSSSGNSSSANRWVGG